MTGRDILQTGLYLEFRFAIRHILSFQVFGEFTRWRVHVAEETHVRLTRLDTCGHKTLFDSVQTEIALVHFAIVPIVKRTGAIRAGSNARSYAFTDVPVGDDNPVGELERRINRAGGNAGGILALIALDGGEYDPRIGVIAVFLGEHTGKEMVGLCFILRLTGDNACLAARAPI
jgi:hypothetical protein